MIAMNGAAVKPERTRHFLLYEAHSGSIKHVYTVMTFPGAAGMSDDHHWERAKNIAEKRGGDLSKLEHAIVENAQQPTGKHKYDHKTKTVIPIKHS